MKMRNTLYKGSSPQEELEFAKTAVALNQPVDVGALLDALEQTIEEVMWRRIAMEDWQKIDMFEEADE